MSTTIEFTIPFLPPSVNSLYEIIWWQRKVQLKPSVEAWKMKVKEQTPAFAPGDDFVLTSLTFYYPFYHANGTLRDFDTHNMVKPLMDAISEKQGWRDKRAKFFLPIWSVDSPESSVKVMLVKVNAEGIAI